MGERCVRNAQVMGSSPTRSTTAARQEKPACSTEQTGFSITDLSCGFRKRGDDLRLGFGLFFNTLKELTDIQKDAKPDSGLGDSLGRSGHRQFFGGCRIQMQNRRFCFFGVQRYVEGQKR